MRSLAANTNSIPFVLDRIRYSWIRSHLCWIGSAGLGFVPLAGSDTSMVDRIHCVVDRIRGGGSDTN